MGGRICRVRSPIEHAVAVWPTTLLYEQRQRCNDRRRDDEGFEDAQRDVGGQAVPRPRAREHHGASTDGTRRLRTAETASRRYAHRAIMSPMRRRASMTPVDSFAGRTRAKSAAATEASPGTAVFASPMSAAAAMRAIQVRAVSVDRSMSIPCIGSIGGGGGVNHQPCLVRAYQHMRGGSDCVASTPP